MIISASLVSALVVQVLCQLFKAALYSIKDGKFTPGYLFAAGGMPSAHSSFVSALSVSLGLRYGFNSDFFAVSFVFSMIIIYDSFRLRGTVQTHSRLLKRLIKYFPEERETLIPQMVGHNILEIIIGIALGTVFALLIYFIWN